MVTKNLQFSGLIQKNFCVQGDGSVNKALAEQAERVELESLEKAGQLDKLNCQALGSAKNPRHQMSSLASTCQLHPYTCAPAHMQTHTDYVSTHTSKKNVNRTNFVSPLWDLEIDLSSNRNQYIQNLEALLGLDQACYCKRPSIGKNRCQQELGALNTWDNGIEWGQRPRQGLPWRQPLLGLQLYIHMQRSEGWLHSAAGGNLVMVSENRGSVSEK